MDIKQIQDFKNWLLDGNLAPQTKAYISNNLDDIIQTMQELKEKFNQMQVSNSSFDVEKDELIKQIQQLEKENKGLKDKLNKSSKKLDYKFKVKVFNQIKKEIPLSKIANNFDISRTSVYNIKKEYKYKIIEDLKAGLSDDEIIQKYKLSKGFLESIKP